MAQKKVIVPAIALMLSLVALTGVGLAYTGTYTDSIDNNTPTVSYYVKVDSSEAISFGEENINILFNTVKDGHDGVFVYTFSNENEGTVDGTTLTMTVEIGSFFVVAGEAPANGTITVDVKDLTTNDFVTGITVTPSASTFNIASAGGETDIIKLTAEIVFTSENIDDENVDDIEIPSFGIEIVATAAEPAQA